MRRIEMGAEIVTPIFRKGAQFNSEAYLPNGFEGELHQELLRIHTYTYIDTHTHIHRYTDITSRELTGGEGGKVTTMCRNVNRTRREGWTPEYRRAGPHE
jgi:hypothetical protein